MVNDGKEAASGRMTEAHPLEPFLPEGARLLMLGSFPPARSRWSMEFYYPNFQNDMWRVMGLVFYGDRERFVAPDGRHFDREAVETFCRERGIALSDTALFANYDPSGALFDMPYLVDSREQAIKMVRDEDVLSFPEIWKGCRRVGPWRLRDRRRPTHWLQSQGANLPRWAVFPNSNFRAAWYAFTVCPPHRGPIPNRWPKRRPFTGRCSPKRDLSPERRPVGPTAGLGTSAGSGKPESGGERMPAVRERDVLPYSYFLYFCDSV